MKEIIFWGATGQAKVLRECIKDSGLELVAVFDNNEGLESPFRDVAIYYGQKGFEGFILKRGLDKPLSFLVAIGGDKGKDRLEMQEYLESMGLIPFVAKHRTAFIADSAEIGVGSQILANSSVCVEVKMGKACIINTGAIIDHECWLKDGVHICPGAHLAGCVEIESYATVGTAAVILPRVKLGEGVIVGAGSVVTNDVPAYSIVAGNPARKIRELTR